MEHRYQYTTSSHSDASPFIVWGTFNLASLDSGVPHAPSVEVLPHITKTMILEARLKRINPTIDPDIQANGDIKKAATKPSVPNIVCAWTEGFAGA